MKIEFKSIFKKRATNTDSLHKKDFNPNYFWALALIIFVMVVALGGLLGLTLFRSVYFEDYKNESEVLSGVKASMNITGLKRAIEKRAALIGKDIPIPADPSL